MSTQDPLFHDDFNDALANAVKALGKHETVARQLWGPSKPRAGQYLSDCLNPQRDAKFSIQELVELLKMLRDRGIHWAMYALCEEVGYGEPGLAARLTEEQKLAARAVDLTKQLLEVQNELAAIQARKA